MGIESGAKIGKVLAKEKLCPKGLNVKRFKKCVGTRRGSAQVAFLLPSKLTFDAQSFPFEINLIIVCN
jgi:hypothetical protein